MSLKYIEQILEIATYYSDNIIAKAYGDWTQENLTTWREKLDALKIERVQVNRGKNATDNRLLIEAGMILAKQDSSRTFMLVSGDADFAALCELADKVIVIGNKNKISDQLKDACYTFYYAQDLEQKLKDIKKEYPIPPSDIRSSESDISWVYKKIQEKKNPKIMWSAADDWVTYTEFEASLSFHREYERIEFNRHSLSEWLRHLTMYYELGEQAFRGIDRYPYHTRFSILIWGYKSLRKEVGKGVLLGQLGKTLREIDPHYENRFKGKKLSEWLMDYADEFTIIGDKVFNAFDFDWNSTYGKMP